MSLDNAFVLIDGHPFKNIFTPPSRNKRMAGVRQGDVHRQILRDRILPTGCRHYLCGIYDVVRSWKPEELGIREFTVGDWRMFSILQAEAVSDRTYILTSKMMIDYEGHFLTEISIRCMQQIASGF